MLFLQDQSQFPSLKQFIYNNIKNSKYDFKNFRWEHSRLRQEHARMIVFKSFEHKNALIWRKKFENSTRSFGGHSILAPHQNFINILFGNHIIITNKKIIKLLESIKINWDELKSLEILLQYSYDEIPFILKKILSFPGKINNEEDWKKIQEKYLPVIQEQIESKKPRSIIKTGVTNFGSSLLKLPEKITTLTSFFNEMNFWRCVSVILLFLYIKEKRWISRFYDLFIKNKTVDVYAE